MLATFADYITEGELSKRLYLGGAAVVAGLGWFSLNFPNNWDQVAAPGTTLIGAGLVIGGLGTFVFPIIYTVLKQSERDKRFYIGSFIIFAGLLAGVAAFTLYSINQLTPGQTFQYRLFAGALGMASSPVMVFGTAVVKLKNTKNTIYSVFIIGGAVPATFWWFQLYPQGLLHSQASASTAPIHFILFFVYSVTHLGLLGLMYGRSCEVHCW